MPSRLRPWVLVAVAVAALVILGASCQNNTKSPVELKAHATRLRELETGVEKMSVLSTEVNTQIQTLQGKDEGLTGEVGGLSGEINGLNSSIAELKKSIESLRADFAANKTSIASVQKKVDSLSSKLSGLDERLWVLEARFNDYVRKHP